MAQNLSQAEREYLYAKLGTDAKPAMRLTQLRRMWYESQVGGQKFEGLESLERRWLKKVIIDAGGSPSSEYSADLWKQALASVGETPVQQTSQNQLVFYRTQK